ncbi:MAG TPA: aspartate kinase [Flavobacteriales bacterium]|nr:aspartate kinase [Flavobacteriales bacterium]
MATIQSAVEEIISNSPFLLENIEDGIINLSSLARKIRPEVMERTKRDVQDGAITMALKRITPKFNPRINLKIRKLFDSTGDIIVRSNLNYTTYLNSTSLVTKQIKLLNMLSEKRNIFYIFSQGIYETTIVLSDSVGKEADHIFKDEQLVTQIRNLSSVTIKLLMDGTNIPGVYYYMIKRISWEGVNVIEVISTTNEFTYMVNESDVEKTFSILKNLNQIR